MIDGVVNLVVLIRLLDRTIKKAHRALKAYDTAQATLDSTHSSGEAFDGAGGAASSFALVAVSSASETHKKNVTYQRVLTALDVHAQHIYLYFYIIENALQVWSG